MKILYLDCGMGAAGDMLTAALTELLPDPEGFVRELNGLGIPDVEFRRETAVKCGITGTHMSVTVHGHEEDLVCHHHDGHTHTHSTRGLAEIHHLVEELAVPEAVRDHVMAVYALLAEAESHAHGVPVTDIRCCEVGTLDALADITAVCLLMDRLAPDLIVASPVHVGSGQVHCAHGVVPVPAPATARILQGVPIYGGSIRGELCTPTGAALLKHFAARFGDMPVLRPTAVGYGMGKKDFEAANCVRAILGETGGDTDRVAELSCNVDDMTAEDIGYAMERLLEGGALDVYTTPIGMKKCRPATLLRVLCAPADKEAMIALLFRHTTTLGVREAELRRHVLTRTVTEVETPCGTLRRKDAAGYGVTRSKYEYDDLCRAAREAGLSLTELRKKLP